MNTIMWAMNNYVVRPPINTPQDLHELYQAPSFFGNLGAHQGKISLLVSAELGYGDK